MILVFSENSKNIKDMLSNRLSIEGHNFKNRVLMDKTSQKLLHHKNHIEKILKTYTDYHKDKVTLLYLKIL